MNKLAGILTDRLNACLSSALPSSEITADSVMAWLFSNPTALERALQTGHDLVCLIEAAPAHADRLMAWVLAHSVCLERVAQKSSYLVYILAATPLYADELMGSFLENTEWMNRIFQSSADLRRILAAAPAYAERLVGWICADPSRSSRVVESTYDMERLIRIAPQHADKLVTWVFGNPTVFARLTLVAETSALQGLAQHLPAQYAAILRHASPENRLAAYRQWYAARETQKHRTTTWLTLSSRLPHVTGVYGVAVAPGAGVHHASGLGNAVCPVASPYSCKVPKP